MKKNEKGTKDTMFLLLACQNVFIDFIFVQSFKNGNINEMLSALF